VVAVPSGCRFSLGLHLAEKISFGFRFGTESDRVQKITFSYVLQEMGRLSLAARDLSGRGPA
jgi:hypothetical protein